MGAFAVVLLAAASVAILLMLRAQDATQRAVVQAQIAGARELADDGRTMPALALALEAAQSEQAPADALVAVAEIAYRPGARRFHRLDDTITAFGASPDGSSLVVGTGRRGLEPGYLTAEARVLAADSGEELLRWPVGCNAVISLAVSPDGSKVATSTSYTDTLRVWSLKTGELLTEVSLGQVAVDSDTRSTPMWVGWLGDNTSLVAVQSECSVTRVDLSGGGTIRWQERVGAKGLCRHVAASADAGRLFVSEAGRKWMSLEPSIRVFDLSDGRQLPALTGSWLGLGAVGLDVDSSGLHLVVGTQDDANEGGSVVVLDLATGELRRLDWLGKSPGDVQTSPDGRLTAGASYHNSVDILDSGSGRLLLQLKGHGDFVEHLVWMGQDRLASAAGHELVTWDLRPGAELLRHEAPEGTKYSQIAVSPNLSIVAAGRFDGTVDLLDTAGGRLMSQLTGHHDTVMQLVFDQTGRRLVTGSADAYLPPGRRGPSLAYWDLDVSKPVAVQSHGDGEPFYYFDADLVDGRRILYPMRSDLVEWVPSTACTRTLAHWGGPGEWIRSVTVPSGSTEAWVALDGSNQISAIDLNTGAKLFHASLHESLIFDLAASGDGRLVVSAGSDGRIGVWDRVRHQLVRSWDSEHGLETADVDAFGRTLATGGGDSSIRIWDLASGREILRLMGHDDYVTGVAFLGDDKLVSSSADGSVRWWRIDRGLGDVLRWVSANRYVPELDCAFKLRYGVESSCVDAADKEAPSVGPSGG